MRLQGMSLSLGRFKPIPLSVEPLGTPGHKTTKQAPHQLKTGYGYRTATKRTAAVYIYFVVHMSYSIQYTFVIYLF